MTRLLAFSAMALAWGLTWLPVKLASAHIPPLHVAACRFTAAGLIFGAAALVTGTPLTTGRPVRLVLASLMITTMSYACVFWGVAHAPSGLAAVVNLSLIPVFSIGIGALCREDTITSRRLIALALGIAGLLLLFSSATRAVGAGTSVGLGLASVALGTAFYAWGAVMSRPLTREMPALAVAFWETLIGGLAQWPLAFALEGFAPERFALLVTEPRVYWSLAFLVVAGSLVGFTVYLWLLREWGPFRAGLYAFVSPVVAVLVGIVFLGERFGPWEGVGMVVMACATALVLPRRERVSAS